MPDAALQAGAAGGGGESQADPQQQKQQQQQSTPAGAAFDNAMHQLRHQLVAEGLFNSSPAYYV